MQRKIMLKIISIRTNDKIMQRRFKLKKSLLSYTKLTDNYEFQTAFGLRYLSIVMHSRYKGISTIFCHNEEQRSSKN